MFLSRYRKWAGNSASGLGSKLPATKSIRSALAEVISTYDITSMLDAPCGDLSWLPLVPGIENVRYTGADISELVVEDNRRKFGVEQGGGGRSDGAAQELGEEVSALVEGGGGLRGPVFERADLVEGVPASEDGEPYDLVFVR